MYVFCVLCPPPFVCGGGLLCCFDDERFAQWAPHVLCDKGVYGEGAAAGKVRAFYGGYGGHAGLRGAGARIKREKEKGRARVHRGAAGKVLFQHCLQFAQHLFMRRPAWCSEGARTKRYGETTFYLPLSSILCGIYWLSLLWQCMFAAVYVLGMNGLFMTVCCRHPLYRGAGARPATD